ncbi:DUF1285 domain-containing protein [Parahaliea mediterranea]|uniref:DUF1285 domain-containing protein n=1 Tax=Parahaliea mediterranea TaxID=651086 RepID=UPI000E2F8CB7|nr:DUF1285 domain-containing protein [Parahaliea mediterranea]
MPASNSSNPTLDGLQQQVQGRRNFDEPPLEKWHPPLLGDIDIVIRSDGSWWHEGAPIAREEIVRLFASILRREADGEYYLVTPGEKWRLQVEAHPLLITAFDRRGEDLVATLNTGKQVVLDAAHGLFLDENREGVAGIQLKHGLTALCSRAAWYRLVAMAEEEGGDPVVRSAGECWRLSSG